MSSREILVKGELRGNDSQYYFSKIYEMKSKKNKMEWSGFGDMNYFVRVNLITFSLVFQELLSNPY
jgi:hypothetical protein